MSNIQILTDPVECRRVWEQVIPPERICDLWDVRACFHRQFNRPLYFIVARDGRRLTGFLPLAWIEESRCYGYFPGETWHGKTWLEQNRIIADDRAVLEAMMNRVNGYGSDIYLRYLTPSNVIESDDGTIDENGYLFYPPDFDYDMENYFRLFSHKSIKRILRDVAILEARGVEYCCNNLRDIELMIRFNLERYGDTSYFSDHRFAGGFREMVRLLHERGWLRLTTLLISGTPAAVDIGAVYGGAYTLLAGGTNAACPGVAKIINLHHMRWACEEKMKLVDFLCGEFSWKPMFHLSPRPLYLLTNSSPEGACESMNSRPPKSPERPAVLEGVAAHA